MESMGLALGLPADTCDNLFIIGLFSLLDTLFDMPMPQILEHLRLSESIRGALLQQQGQAGLLLQLAQACEQEALRTVPELSQQAGLDSQQLNQAHIAALAWVEELGL